MNHFESGLNIFAQMGVRTISHKGGGSTHYRRGGRQTFSAGGGGNDDDGEEETNVRRETKLSADARIFGSLWGPEFW